MTPALTANQPIREGPSGSPTPCSAAAGRVSGRQLGLHPFFLHRPSQVLLICVSRAESHSSSSMAKRSISHKWSPQLLERLPPVSPANLSASQRFKRAQQEVRAHAELPAGLTSRAPFRRCAAGLASAEEQNTACLFSLCWATLFSLGD